MKTLTVLITVLLIATSIHADSLSSLRAKVKKLTAENTELKAKLKKLETSKSESTAKISKWKSIRLDAIERQKIILNEYIQEYENLKKEYKDKFRIKNRANKSSRLALERRTRRIKNKIESLKKDIALNEHTVSKLK